MKAVICSRYGTPDVLQVKEVAMPVLKDNEVLIEIHATSVNSGDVFIRKGSFMVRLIFGFTKPRKDILGVVVSGKITKIGRKVTRFKVGDPVFGTTGMSGAYAEYVSLSQDGVLTIKPDSISHIEAASIPFGGNTALFFAQKARIKEGQKVLIYGASGAVGTSAVQVVKSFGAVVTGVCSTVKLELVKSLGADNVIDYTCEEYLKDGDQYDIIWDTVGKMDHKKARKHLAKNGLIISSAKGFISTKKKLSGIIKETAEGMSFLKELIERGVLKPVIDRVYPLEQIVEAHTYVDTGRKKGNVVIEIIL
jgi:NADPH:quinone reductase-like Zn-dependent oxidoreductase